MFSRQKCDRYIYYKWDETTYIWETERKSKLNIKFKEDSNEIKWPIVESKKKKKNYYI